MKLQVLLDYLTERTVCEIFAENFRVIQCFLSLT